MADRSDGAWAPGKMRYQAMKRQKMPLKAFPKMKKHR